MNPIHQAGEAVPEKPTDYEIAEAMLTLEHDIACIASMAKILGGLLDDLLVDCDDEVKAGKELYKVMLGAMEMDMLSFAWNDVIARAGRLDHAFHEAVKGRVVQ